MSSCLPSQVITLEGWVDIMYYVMDAHSFYNFIYFILLIIVSVGMASWWPSYICWWGWGKAISCPFPLDVHPGPPRVLSSVAAVGWALGAGMQGTFLAQPVVEGSTRDGRRPILTLGPRPRILKTVGPRPPKLYLAL